MSSQYNSNDSFAVVGQPFLVDATVPSKKTAKGEITDFSFLSEDCFHFSQKTHAAGQFSCLSLYVTRGLLLRYWVRAWVTLGLFCSASLSWYRVPQYFNLLVKLLSFRRHAPLLRSGWVCQLPWVTLMTADTHSFCLCYIGMYNWKPKTDTRKV
jgi:hypothetical protein